MPESLNRERLRHKTLGALWGVFIGDSFALPVECKSPREIQHLYGYLDTFVDNKHHSYKNVARRAAGTISDDSQLTLAMMDSLRRKNGYSLHDIKFRHFRSFMNLRSVSIHFALPHKACRRSLWVDTPSSWNMRCLSGSSLMVG